MLQKVLNAIRPQLNVRDCYLLIILFAFPQMIFPTLARSQTAEFNVGTISSYNTTGFVTSAYPDIDRLANGRLICIFACIDSTKSIRMKIAVSISDDNGISWSKPKIIFDHTNALFDADPNLLVAGDSIFAFSTTLPRLSHRIDSTSIFERVSHDGINWGPEREIKLPHRYICGKIHRGYKLNNGTLVMGYSYDTWAEQHMYPATEGQMNLKSAVFRSKDGGITWLPGADIYADVKKTSPDATGGLAEPAIAVLADGKLLVLLRAGGERLYETWSTNGGLDWSIPHPSQLTAHNSPAALWKLDNSPDVLVAWDNSPTGRETLAAALSKNEGKTWSKPRIIVKTGGPEASYPSAIQAQNGTMIVVWQQVVNKGRDKREIKIARFNRTWLLDNK